MPDLISFPGEPSFPGMNKLPLPATPGDKDARQVLIAHRVDDTVRAIAHAEERMSAALKATGSSLRGYHSIHIANHMAVALNNMHFLVEDLKLHYPAEYAELTALRQCMGLTRSLNKETRAATTAHLTETVLHELTHAKRHADQMLKPDPKLVWEFNADHVHSHLKGAQEHIDKLSEHVTDNYPGEGRWLRLLKQLQDGRLATDMAAWKELKLAARPQTLQEARYRETGSEDRNCHTCEYSARWSGRDGYCTMFKAPVQRGHVCDEWEQGKVTLARSVMDTPVPAKRADQYGLHMVPSQTTSPSPPLPPGATLPTPREVRAIIKLVPDGIDASLSTGTRKFLETAAVKLEKNDPVEALAALRGAQSSLYAASRKDAALGMPAVYGASMVPAAEKSSALARMQVAYQQQSGAWRKIGTEVAVMIDRIRRHWFRGRINGYSPNMRI
jgi:hypothetical protein